MIDKNDIYADLHIHTIASLHAFSTLRECIEEASRKSLLYIAVTDHFYNDGSVLMRKNEISRMMHLENHVQNNCFGVKVISGAEFNVAQDIPSWQKLKRLKWKLIGTHGWFIDRDKTSFEDLYHYYEESSSRFESFAHIERELSRFQCNDGNFFSDKMKVFLKKIVALARKNDVYLELNEESLKSQNTIYREAIIYWLKIAKENGNIISLGSDAHYYSEVGDFQSTLSLLNDLDYRRENILNCDLDRLQEIFK